MTKKLSAPKPARSPKSKRTEVIWAQEDVTRRYLAEHDDQIAMLHKRLLLVEDWIAQQPKQSSTVSE